MHQRFIILNECFLSIHWLNVNTAIGEREDLELLTNALKVLMLFLKEEIFAKCCTEKI